jgi:hypothetical protein
MLPEKFGPSAIQSSVKEIEWSRDKMTLVRQGWPISGQESAYMVGESMGSRQGLLTRRRQELGFSVDLV